MHAQASHSSDTVMEAYRCAASFAEESGNLKHQVINILLCVLVYGSDVVMML